MYIHKELRIAPCKSVVAMCAVILIFAFTMSLVVNFVERTITSTYGDEKPVKPEPEEALITDNQDKKK